MTDLSKILLDGEFDARDIVFKAKYGEITRKLRRLGQCKIGSKLGVITRKPLINFMKYFAESVSKSRGKDYVEFWITQGDSEPIKENGKIVGYINHFERTN